MFTRLDKFVIGLLALILVPGIVLPVAIEGPMFARCTQVALDALDRADPLDRHPPPTLVRAIDEENRHPNIAWKAAQWAVFYGECNGPPRDSNLTWRLHTIPLGWWFGARLSEDDLLGLYVSQIYLGNKTYGFAAGARYYYGHELNQLTADEQRCLARKTRNLRNACNGK